MASYTLHSASKASFDGWILHLQLAKAAGHSAMHADMNVRACLLVHQQQPALITA
jgi:hypothetical protein